MIWPSAKDQVNCAGMVISHFKYSNAAEYPQKVIAAEYPQKGLLVSISPRCTLSQNGYGICTPYPCTDPCLQSRSLTGGNCVSQKTVKWLGRGSSYGKQTFGHQFNSRCGRFLACLLIVFLFSLRFLLSCWFLLRLPAVPDRSRPFPTVPD